MRNEPTDLTPAMIRDALARWWGIDATEVTYAPVGFGSYHWVATRASDLWFVTADRTTSDHIYDAGNGDAVYNQLNAVLQSVLELTKSGLGFVIAPIPDAKGVVLRRLDPSWALAVYPYIDGYPAGPGQWTIEEVEQDVAHEAAHIVGLLHSTSVPPLLPRWDARVPFRAALEAALQDLETPWDRGPYSERVRLALKDARFSLRDLFARYDRLVERLLADESSWVVSHGEPHSANFLRERDGRLLLIDWDTLCLAPRERDAFFMSRLPWGSGPVSAGDSYRDVAGLALRPFVRDLFDYRWTLNDISIFARYLMTVATQGLDEEAIWHLFDATLKDLPGNLLRYSPT